MKHAFAAALLVWSAVAFAQKLAPIPSPTVRVNDNASMLSENQEATLDRAFDAYERADKIRFVLLTVASTAPEQIEYYGGRVAEAWKIGRPDGTGDVIIVVARDNRGDLGRVRIEVRPDLQRVLTADLMARVVAEDVLPRFQYLDYNGGLTAAFGRIKFLLGGGVMPPPSVEAVAVIAEAAPWLDRNVAIAGGIFVLVMLALFLRHATMRRMSYLAGDRAINRAFTPMIVGGFVGRARVADLHEGNGFGGGYVGPGVGGYAGGGGDFSGGSASGKW